MRHIFLPFLMIVGLALPAAAQPSGRVADLTAALRLADLVEVMRSEGLVYGREVEQEMFAGRGGDRWAAAVDRIYDPDRMLTTLTDTLEAEMSGTETAPLIAYFTSDPGAGVVEREISARRALLDPGAEAQSVLRLEEMRADNDPRLDLLGRLIAANDLIEQNVVGALNANFAFYAGMTEGGAFAVPLTDTEMLRDVWTQEADIRAETEDWLYSYLALAYGPVSDATLEGYLALSETEAGQRLNAALFAGFDRAFVRISRELGLAAARFVAGEDI